MVLSASTPVGVVFPVLLGGHVTKRASSTCALLKVRLLEEPVQSPVRNRGLLRFLTVSSFLAKLRMKWPCLLASRDATALSRKQRRDSRVAMGRWSSVPLLPRRGTTVFWRLCLADPDSCAAAALLCCHGSFCIFLFPLRPSRRRLSLCACWARNLWTSLVPLRGSSDFRSRTAWTRTLEEGRAFIESEWWNGFAD